MLEDDLIGMMKDLKLNNLVYLLWTSIKINKGGELFKESLEKHLTRKLATAKDEDLVILLNSL